MPRDFRVRIDDILESIAKIKDYTRGMSADDFKWDRKTQDAVIRNFQIIGEAANHIPREVKDNCKDNVEWAKIVGFRNIAVHEYFGITVDIVWDIIQNKLAILEGNCKYLLEKYGNEPFLDNNK